MYITEAAVRYSVGRGKLHRLIQQGRLETYKDPADERVTLLRIDDLDEMFRFPVEEGGQMLYRTGAEKSPPGYLTDELRERMDAVRTRISKRLKGRTLPDSADLIRREREKRTRQIDRAVSGGPSRSRDKRDA